MDKTNKVRLSEADEDVVIVSCGCGNKFALPRDCLMFGLDQMFCGRCSVTGDMKVTNYNPTEEEVKKS